MWILEHWERADLDEWADGRRTTPLPEGMVIGHQGYRDEAVIRLQDENPSLKCFDYYNVWTYPPNEWLGGGNGWFDWLATQLGKGYLWIDSQTGYPGVTIAYGGRVVVRWKDNHARALDVILETRRARHGFFFDMFFPAGPAQWMFNGFAGKFSVERLPPNQIDEHMEELAGLVIRAGGYGVVMINGALHEEHPGYGRASRYLEGTGTFSARPFSAVEPVWKAHSGNVISAMAENTQARDQAIALWAKWGGWLAFTTQRSGQEGAALTNAAYQKARDTRAALGTDQGPPPDPGPGPGPGTDPGEPGPGGGPGTGTEPGPPPMDPGPAPDFGTTEPHMPSNGGT